MARRWMALGLLACVAACGHPAPDPGDLLWAPGASLLDDLDAARVVSLPAASLPPAVAATSSGPLRVEYAAADWRVGRPLDAATGAALAVVDVVAQLGADARRFHLDDPVRLDLPRGALSLALDGRELVPYRDALGDAVAGQQVYVDPDGGGALWFVPASGRVSFVGGRAPDSLVVSYAGDDGRGLAAWEWAPDDVPTDGDFPRVVTSPDALPDAERLARRVTLGDTTRDALVVPAPGAVGFDVDVRDVASVSVSVGMVDHGYLVASGTALRAAGASDGARVSVVLERANERAELWSADVQPGEPWRDVELPLGGALDDPRCTLWLVSDPGDDAAFDYVAWGGLRARGRDAVVADADPRPNVLMIVLDTLRDDTLGQARPPATPRLDAWAAEHGATRYTHARTPAPWTLPAVVSLCSGLDPLQHGVDAPTDRMGAGLPHVAELLADAGYETFAQTGAGYLSPAFGLDRGFATFVARADHDVLPDWSESRAWLEARRSAAPFFALAHTYHVHATYLHDPRFESADDPYGGKLAGRDVDYDSVIVPFIDGRLPLDEADRAYVRRMYDAGAARTDAVVVELLDVLEASGALDDTLVIVTSDHGEEFFEHGAIGHGHSLHGELVEIPLLVRWPPGLVEPRPEPVSRRRTSLTDLFATCLDLADVPAPAATVGTSLRVPVPPDRPLVASLPSSQRHDDGDFVLLVGPGERVALYDADDDPAGARNLAARQPERAERLRRRLERHVAGLPAVEAGDDAATLDAAEIEALRAMGYLEDR